MKRLLTLTIALLALCSGRCLAISPVVSLGVEWGVEPQFATMHRFNYVCAEGYRVNDQWSGVNYHTNAFITGNISFNLGQWFRLGLYSGYSGISKNVNVVPVTLRLSFFPKGWSNTGFLYFLDGGTGFQIHKADTPSQAPSILVKGGAGYRYILSSQTSLDFLLTARGAVDNPLILDPDGHGYVMDVRYSTAAYFAIGFSVALNF